MSRTIPQGQSPLSSGSAQGFPLVVFAPKRPSRREAAESACAALASLMLVAEVGL
jgi:hypothetical protein